MRRTTEIALFNTFPLISLGLMTLLVGCAHPPKGGEKAGGGGPTGKCEVGGYAQELVILCPGSAGDLAFECFQGRAAGEGVKVQVDVGVDGKICGASVVERRLADDASIHCIVRELRTWRGLRPGRSDYLLIKPPHRACIAE
jgi:hypothetical protein